MPIFWCMLVNCIQSLYDSVLLWRRCVPIRYTFSVFWITSYLNIIDVLNVCNVYQFFLINAFVIFVNVYYFNKSHMKCRKKRTEIYSLLGLCCRLLTVWEWILLTAARTEISILHKLQKYSIQSLQTVWKKCQRSLSTSTSANVCYFFIINAFINVYYYFLDV